MSQRSAPPVQTTQNAPRRPSQLTVLNRISDLILGTPAMNNFPEPRDYSSEMSNILRTQVELAPQIYDNEAQFRPQYARLDYDIFSEMMPKYLQAQVDAQPLANRLSSMARQADINDILQLSPQAMDAIRSANPEAAGLLDEMTRQASSDVALGKALSADERRAVLQNTRAGFADRGMAMSNPAVFAEVMGLDTFGRQRQAERRSFATDVLNLNKQQFGDPFMQILGRPSSGVNTNQFVPASMKVGPQLFNPESQYASNLYGGNQQSGMQIGGIQAGMASDAWNTLFNAQQARDIAMMNNAAASDAARMGMIGSLGGAAITGGALAFCWIARAAYGEDNPRWLLFRRWVLTKAPAWFVAWYLRFGPEIGAKIKDDPEARGAIRAWMDGILKVEVQHAL